MVEQCVYTALVESSILSGPTMNRTYNERKHKRFVKGMKRIKEDRAQHGRDHSCPCFSQQASRGKGAEFARFADTPKVCSNSTCCGNPREVDGPTRQEIRGPRVEEW
jgi:hypothetical protein